MQQFSPQWKKCLTSAGPKLSQKTGIVIAFLCRDVKSVLFLTWERRRCSGEYLRKGKRKRWVWSGCTCVSLLVCKGRAKWVDLHAKCQGCREAGPTLENFRGLESNAEELCCATQELEVKFCGGVTPGRSFLFSPHMCRSFAGLLVQPIAFGRSS